MNLYLFQFGGSRASALFEAHEVRLAFGETVAAALETIADEVKATLRSAHVDGYAEIGLEPASGREDRQLFLVETGSNGPGMFEQHGYEFVWATDARTARARAGRPAPGWHVDTVFNVSRAAGRAGYAVRQHADTGEPCIPRQHSLYRRL